MQLLTTILFFILAIAPLIVIHELGHLFVGRLFGVRADVFSVGFGRVLGSRVDRHGTRWQVAAIPMGGYVKFAGDMGASSTPDPAWLALPAEERNRTFQAKPTWQRALIVAAGPAVNFVFAFVMVAAIFSIYGEPRIAPEVGGFSKASSAQAAGMRVGDRIVVVDGTSIEQFDDIGMIVQARAERAIEIVVERSGARQSLTVTPRLEQVKDLAGVEVPMGRIGVAPARVDLVRLSPLELPHAAGRFIVQSVHRTIVALVQIVRGERSVRELGGPVKIAATSNAVAKLGLVTFLLFMAAVSINLGFINLLPIPTLDGGHLAFYAAEAVRRRPVGLAAQEWAFRGGLVLLLAFMLFVTINDLTGLGLFAGLTGLIG